MTTTRPSKARKHTRTTEENRTGALDSGIRMTVDGEAYEVRLGEVTSSLARELRRGTGMKLSELLGEIANDPDVDSIAGFVWLARRLRGEQVDIDDVVITYVQLLDDGFDVAVLEQGGPDPEA